MSADNHPNAHVITQFYQAFQQRDFAAMQACYHPDISFEDAVFKLKGKQVHAMWHMLCLAGKDLSIHFDTPSADAEKGAAHWIATYTFSATGRSVRNVVSAQFTFQDGKIIRHHDSFSFYHWLRQAIGPFGALMGWTPWLQNKVRATALLNLNKFIEAHPEYA